MLEKKPKIWNKTPKISQNSIKLWKIVEKLKPRNLLKSFLRWLRLRDSTGELLVKQDTNIDEITLHWSRQLIQWLLAIFVTGFLWQIALLPLWNPGLKMVPFTMFSLGIAYFMLLELIKDVRNAIKKGV